MDWLKETAQIVSFFVSLLALLSAIMFFVSRNKEREKETFDYVDDKFLSFLDICMAKPYLDIFDTPDEVKIELNEMQKKEEKVAFAYLMSIFERVYVFYHDNKRACDADQFINWQKTIKEYFDRENFRKAWKENGYGWDAGFINFMDEFYLKAEKKMNLVDVTPKEIDQWADLYDPFFNQKDDNDSKDQIKTMFNNRKKQKYNFYFIRKCADKPEHETVVGGVLTKKIGKTIIILYIFTLEKYRKLGYAAQAVRYLKAHYDDKYMFLAESEHKENKDDQLNEWWTKNAFSEIDMTYYTPTSDKITHKETGSHVDNDLMIYYARPVSKYRLMRTLSRYFKYSFLKPTWKPAFMVEAVRKNNKQIRKFKRSIKIKI